MNNYYQPSNYSLIPPVVKNLIIINVIFFIVSWLFIPNLEDFLGLQFGFNFLKPWQFITYMFLHGGFSHLFFNMFALWMFGAVIEQSLGAQKFLYFYLVCGVGAAVIQLIVLYFLNGGPNTAVPLTTIGASGSVFGLLFAFGYLFPNMKIYIYFLFPLKAKYFVIIYALIELYMGIQANPGDNVAHFAHLGGMLFAFILLKIWKTPRRLY